MKYFGRVKHHSGLERNVMEEVVSERRYRHRSAQKWIQDIKDTLVVKTHEAEETSWRNWEKCLLDYDESNVLDRNCYTIIVMIMKIIVNKYTKLINFKLLTFTDTPVFLSVVDDSKAVKTQTWLNNNWHV